MTSSSLIAWSLELKNGKFTKKWPSFTRLLSGGAPHLAIDMSKLDYISSAGLRVLLVVARRMQLAKGKVVLFGLLPNVREVFAISGFDKIFSIHSDAEAAIAAIG